MKRVYFSLCLAFIVIALCLVSVFSLKNFKEEICEKTEAISRDISSLNKDAENVSLDLENLIKLWEKKKTLLSYITKQDAIIEMNEKFSEITFYIYNNEATIKTNISEIKKILFEIKTLAENIYENELPVLKNVL